MSYLYNEFVYKCFMYRFDNNICCINGKRYSDETGDKYICGIDDCVDYYDTVVKLLLYNIKCKKIIQEKAYVLAFMNLRCNHIPYDIRNLIRQFL